MASLRPMLATSKGGGKFCLLSTPFGKRGAYWEYWSAGGDDWHRVEVPASAICPHRQSARANLVPVERGLPVSVLSHQSSSASASSGGEMRLPCDG